MFPLKFLAASQWRSEQLRLEGLERAICIGQQQFEPQEQQVYKMANKVIYSESCIFTI